jgi:hypothetical protein
VTNQDILRFIVDNFPDTPQEDIPAVQTVAIQTSSGKDMCTLLCLLHNDNSVTIRLWEPPTEQRQLTDGTQKAFNWEDAT